MKKRPWLLPFSLLYKMGVMVRNACFDRGLFSSTAFPLPIIGIGNLSVGGTGKTPHTEYLLELLSGSFKTAVLSRGYKRATRGFLRYTQGVTATDIGDEPYQIAQKFPQVYVAVHTDRVAGVKRLLSDKETANVEVVLLDDAYQHRYIKAGLQILLIDHNRPIGEDYLLPAGTLREPKEEKRRADIVLITKCPPAIDRTKWEKDLHLSERQKLFFSTFQYRELYYLSSGKCEIRPTRQTHVLLLVGIASPAPLLEFLKGWTTHIEILSFPDHHTFTEADIEKICVAYESMAMPRMFITTEKDATRLVLHRDVLQDRNVYEEITVLPIRVKFLENKEQEFNQIVTDYVTENRRNSCLPTQ